MIVNAYAVNAFTKNGNGGNPAGVVLDAQDFDDEMMQSIATTLCHSETAFVVARKDGEFDIRYFTPVEEVKLCGHATIAAFHILRERGRVKNGQFTINTAAGKFIVWVNRKKIVMQQAKPEFFSNHPKTKIANMLGLDFYSIHKDLPCQVVSSGLRDIMVPVKDLETLLKIKPNMNKIKKYCAENNVVSLHVFSLETKSKKSVAQCRNFAPAVGTPEESATGISNAALASYLFKHGVIDGSKAKKLVFEQGYAINLPSEIIVELSVEQNDINEVRVGGYSNVA